jgi:hypothetical protein
MADCRAGTLFLTLEEFSCRGDGMETMFFADCRIGPPYYEPSIGDSAITLAGPCGREGTRGGP